MLTQHETWQILDSSKLQTFMDCPRRYFYTYILGWQQDAMSQDLVFGDAWHNALESLYTTGFSKEGIELAKAVFLDVYREKFSEETDHLYSPKGPMEGLHAIEEYAYQYANDLDRYNILEVEIAGTVPISESFQLHFRMDLIAEDKKTGKITAFEHKTTKRGGRQWEDQWILSPQVGTYTHALYCLFPMDRVYGVQINGAIFTKDPRFLRVPCARFPEQMEQWLWNTRWWAQQVRVNTEPLLTTESNYRWMRDQPVFQLFPLNPQSCTKYWGCTFHDFCTAWPNPLKRADEVPLGFKQEWWNPAARPAKKRISL